MARVISKNKRENVCVCVCDCVYLCNCAGYPNAYIRPALSGGALGVLCTPNLNLCLFHKIIMRNTVAFPKFQSSLRESRSKMAANVT